ncbi:Nn.00g015620.m01.CDS01 [Neocucurbitaria sp. VM-36]
MRVIQDSDDDFDDNLEADVSPTKGPAAPTQQLTNNTPQPGTGSTESLKRAIEQAHRTHLQSQASQNEPPSSVSLPSHPSKRRKTSAGFDTRKSPEVILSQRDGPITYSKRSRPVLNSALVGQVDDHLDNAATGHATLSNQTALSMDNLMRDSYISHDPMALFPEPSSTVPNATLTQQRVMETVTAPTMLGNSGADTPHYRFPPEPSVPLSDVLFPPSNTSEQLESSNQEHRALHVSTDAALETPQQAYEPYMSQRSSDDDLATANIPLEQYKPRPSRSRSLKVDADQSMDYSIRPEKAKKVSKRRKMTVAASDTNATSTPEKIRQICDMGFTPSTTERALEQNSGDITQAVDWLVRNGIGEDELASHNTPKKKPASKGSNEFPSVDHDTIKVIMHGLKEYRRHDPESSQNVLKATGAASATVQADIVEDDTKSSKTDVPHDVVQNMSPKVQVVITKKSPRTGSTQTPSSGEASKKPKRRKTTSDQPEPGPLLESHIVAPVKHETKRGRGRPKKVATPAPSAHTTSEVPEVSTELDEHAEAQSTILNIGPASTTSTEVELNIQLNGAQTHELKSRQDEAFAVKLPPKHITTTTTSETPERSTKPSTHSPNDKGKVSYRVGLSKRARIAPLLRTLKK